MNKRSILSEVKEIDMLIIRKTMQEAKNNNIPIITPIQCRIIEYLMLNVENFIIFILLLSL